MVDEVLFEHETPALDDVEQRLLEGLGVHAEPRVQKVHVAERRHLLVDLLVRVDLHPNNELIGLSTFNLEELHFQHRKKCDLVLPNILEHILETIVH